MNTSEHIFALNEKVLSAVVIKDQCPYYVMPCDCAGPGGLPLPPHWPR